MDPCMKSAMPWRKLPASRGSEDFTGEQMAAIKDAKEVLFDAFGEVDATLHGKEGKTYDEMSNTIDAALRTITDIAGVANESQAPAPITNEGAGETEPVEAQEAEAPPTDEG